jgi:hypothetical protein
MDKNADEIELIILKTDKSNKVIAPRYRHSEVQTLGNCNYRIYSRIIREILDKNWNFFFSFDLYTGH